MSLATPDQIRDLLDRRNGAPWEAVRQKLNQKLQGGRQYFSLGTVRPREILTLG